MSRYHDPYPPYVSVAQRRINAQKELQKLQKKGRVIDPLGELTHRLKIATSFWGSAWCKHLESFSDYENRLPRGRTGLERSAPRRSTTHGAGSCCAVVIRMPYKGVIIQ